MIIGHFGIRQTSDGVKPETYVLSITGTHIHDVVRSPLSYILIWYDKNSGAYKDGAMWKVKCPNGYDSLSDLCTSGYDDPPLDATVCINKTYLVSDRHDVLIYDIYPSNADIHLDINGGGTYLTKELISVTTDRGTKKSLKAIKPNFISMYLNMLEFIF